MGATPGLRGFPEPAEDATPEGTPEAEPETSQEPPDSSLDAQREYYRNLGVRPPQHLR